MVVHSFVYARQAMVLACGLVCGLAGSGAHAADYLASASAALSNVSFNLVSLAPQSGLAPSIKFGQPGFDGSVTLRQGWAYAAGQTIVGADGVPVAPYGHDDYFDAPLPTQPIQQSSTDGLTGYAVNQSGISSSITLPLDVTTRMAASLNALNTGSAVTSGTPLIDLPMNTDGATGRITLVPDSTFAQPVDFTLSAHTTLTLTADASVSLTGGPGADPLFSSPSAYMIASASISLSRSVATHPLQGAYDTWFDYVDDLHAAYEWQSDGVSVVYPPEGDSLLSDGRHVTLTLVNDTDHEVTGLFALNVGTFVNVTLPDDVPVVPEPATYLMMGLGLVGLGLRRRLASRRI